MNPLAQRLNAGELLNLQRSQYNERLFIHDVVPAGLSQRGSVTVSNLGSFYCCFITGTFSTIASPGGGAVVDTGVNYLSGQLIDGNGNKRLFDQRIPLDLLFSPGRRKDVTSTTVIADPPGNALFYPLPFEYLFPESTLIEFDVNNTSDEPNSYELCLHGFRLVGQTTMQGRNSDIQVI